MCSVGARGHSQQFLADLTGSSVLGLEDVVLFRPYSARIHLGHPTSPPHSALGSLEIYSVVLQEPCGNRDLILDSFKACAVPPCYLLQCQSRKDKLSLAKGIFPIM